MNIKAKTRIVVEQYRRCVLQVRQSPSGAFCIRCDAESPLIKPEAAAAVTGRSQRELFQMIEVGSVHFFENSGGELFLCGASLSAADCLKKEAQDD